MNYLTTISRRRTKAYQAWMDMKTRCYNLKHQIKNPSYKGCSVCESWLDFQVFAAYYYDNYRDGCQLDKDLLVVGNKIYSPENCVFVPNWLNSFLGEGTRKRSDYLIGVYFDNQLGFYRSRCRNEGKNKHLGLFTTEEEAHLAWRKYKLALALDKKPKMDEIDLRIYPNVVQMIMEAR